MRKRTPDEIAEKKALRQTILSLHAEGTRTYGEIANQVGTTRNVVAGIINRATALREMVPLGKWVASPEGKARQDERTTAAHKLEPQSPPAPKPLLCEPVSLLDAKPQHCRWVVGRLLYCGMPIAYKSFCEVHASIGYLPYARRTK